MHWCENNDELHFFGYRIGIFPFQAGYRHSKIQKLCQNIIEYGIDQRLATIKEALAKIVLSDLEMMEKDKKTRQAAKNLVRQKEILIL